MSRYNTEWAPIIAVDFDGTITDKNDFLGLTLDSPLKRGVRDVLKRLKSRGATIILWTCREGEHLAKAIDYCIHHGIPIDYWNRNTPEVEEAFGGDSRKIYADYYIDDLAFDKSESGIDWEEIEYHINAREMFFRCGNCAYYNKSEQKCKRLKPVIDSIVKLDYSSTYRLPTDGCRKFIRILEEGGYDIEGRVSTSNT